MTATAIKRGMRIVWKPQWRDKGDDKYTFVAVTDEHPIDGSFHTSIVESRLWSTLSIRPIQTGARADMVESAEPYLPVGTLTFLGLTAKGARVRFRRMLGDRELSTSEETMKLSTFRHLFRRYAVDCEIGSELQSGVEFPEEKL